MVTRSGLPQNYIKSPGTVFDDFSSYASWTTTAAGVKELDETYTRHGASSVKLTNATAGNACSISRTGLSHKFNLDDPIELRFYLHTTASTINNLVIYIGTTSFLNYYQCVTTTLFTAGWNILLLKKDMFTVAGGSPTWDTTMTKVQIQITPNTGQTVSISFDCILLSNVGMSKFCIYFDDGNKSDYEKAYAKMGPLGMRGVLLPNGSNVGDASHVSVAQLQEMYAAGWDIANHTYNHPDLTTLTQAGVESEISLQQDWLIDNGMPRAANHLAYPGGARNATVYAAMAACGILTGRLISMPYNLIRDPIEDIYQLPVSLYLVQTSTFAAAKAIIDNAIRFGNICIVMVHKIADSPGEASEVSTAVFDAVIDYLYQLHADVVNIDELYNGLTNLRYRSLPLTRA